MDRSVRRARRHLDTSEVVMASTLALEGDGRRRQVLVVTDRRVLVTGMRGQPSTEFPLDGTACTWQRTGGRLTLRSADHQLAVHGVDELASRTIVQLLGARASRRSAQEAVRLGRPTIDGITAPR